MEIDGAIDCQAVRDPHLPFDLDLTTMCPTCGKSLMIHHYEIYHKGKKVCTLCGKKLSKSISKHLKTNHPALYEELVASRKIHNKQDDPFHDITSEFFPTLSAPIYQFYKMTLKRDCVQCRFAL